MRQLLTRCRSKLLNTHTLIGISRNGALFLVLVFTPIFFESCYVNTEQIYAIPNKQRHTIAFASITDLTGNFSTIQSSIINLTENTINVDFVEVLEHDSRPPLVRVYPNPLKIEQNLVNHSPEFVLHGEVERISYEPLRVIRESALYQSLSTHWTTQSLPSETMTGLIQYRFYISNQSHEPIDTFVTIGVSYGSIESVTRRELLEKANENAACNIVNDIFSALLRTQRYKWNLPSEIAGSVLEHPICSSKFH